MEFARLQSGVADELGDLGRGFKDGIGTGFREVAIPAERFNHATNAFGCLIDRDGHIATLEVKCRGQPRDAAANDCHRFHRPSD